MANETAKKDTAKKETKKRFQLKPYLKEMTGEVKKLSWLNKKDLIKNTAMVLVFVLVMSGVIYLLDMAFGAGVQGLSNLTAPAATAEPVEETAAEATAEPVAETAEETAAEVTAEPAAETAAETTAEVTAEPAN